MHALERYIALYNDYKINIVNQMLLQLQYPYSKWKHGYPFMLGLFMGIFHSVCNFAILSTFYLLFYIVTVLVYVLTNIHHFIIFITKNSKLVSIWVWMKCLAWLFIMHTDDILSYIINARCSKASKIRCDTNNFYTLMQCFTTCILSEP